jgi:hypothetical protein
MTWRAMGLADIASQVKGAIQLKRRGGMVNAARHVTGCHSTKQTRIQRALDDRGWRILLATS